MSEDEVVKKWFRDGYMFEILHSGRRGAPYKGYINGEKYCTSNSLESTGEKLHEYLKWMEERKETTTVNCPVKKCRTSTPENKLMTHLRNKHPELMYTTGRVIEDGNEYIGTQDNLILMENSERNNGGED